MELDGLIDRYNLTIPIEERNEVLAQVIRHIVDMTHRLTPPEPAAEIPNWKPSRSRASLS